jgi:O-antigen ligase
MFEATSFIKHFKIVSIWPKFSLITVCILAVCVSLGAALISISKALVLIAVLGNLAIQWRARNLHWPRNQPWTIWSIYLAISWMLLSFLWTEASLPDAMTGMLRHSRLLWLVAVFYLIQNKNEAFTALKFLVIGQLFVVICSCLMWLGVPIPWAKSTYPPELGILFTSTLEQPIMSTLMLALIWFNRVKFQNKWMQSIIWVVILTTMANVLLIMTGRTGYLVILLFICMATFFILPVRFRIFSVVLPIILGFTLMTFPTRFQSRVSAVISDVQNYQPSKFEYGQATRIDYWYYSIISFKEKPLLGHGVGSWKENYKRLGGIETDPPSNPHQQYLLWAVESGSIGLILIITFLVCLAKDAINLPKNERQSLITITAIAALAGLMNCPFFGVGMGEFFLTIFALLLVQKQPVELISNIGSEKKRQT